MAPFRLCDNCNRVMMADQKQSVGETEEGNTTFVHTACIRPEQKDRMMPIDDWLGSGISSGKTSWPWKVEITQT